MEEYLEYTKQKQKNKKQKQKTRLTNLERGTKIDQHNRWDY